MSGVFYHPLLSSVYSFKAGFLLKPGALIFSARLEASKLPQSFDLCTPKTWGFRNVWDASLLYRIYIYISYRMLRSELQSS